MLKIAVSRGFGEGCKQVDYSVTVQDTNKRFRTRLVHQKRGPQLRGFVVKKISGEMPHFDISVVFFFKKSENHHMRPSRTMRRKTPVKVSFFWSNGITFDLHIVWLWFFYQCHTLIQGQLFNIYNIVITPTQKILSWFEVESHAKKRLNFDMDLSFIHVTFWPNWKNLFLLRHNMFETSGDTLIVTTRFPWV